MFSKDKQHEVGKISKQWSGLAREFFTDADNFGVSCKFNPPVLQVIVDMSTKPILSKQP